MRTPRALVYVVAVVLLATGFASRTEAGRPGSGGTGGRGSIPLTPESEVPSPGDVGASGQAQVSIRKSQVCFEVSVQNLTSVITTIQIHRGAVGQEGPAVVTLSPIPPGINGLSGCPAADAEVLRDISRNPRGYYVNVHTLLHPGGAIRGQLGQ